MRRFCVVSTVMGNDEKCLLLRVVLSAKILESCLFAARAGSDLWVPHGGDELATVVSSRH